MLRVLIVLTLGLSAVARSYAQENDYLRPEELRSLKDLLIQEEILKEGVSQEAFQNLELKEIQNALTRVFYLQPLTEPISQSHGREGEFLLPNLFYSQLENFSIAESSRLQEEWMKASKLKADALLLDLRTEMRSDDPMDLIPFLEAFVPSGTVLFRSYEKDHVIELYVSQAEPFWKGSLHVLIDEESSDSAKFLASLLHLHAGAQLFGKLDIEEVYSFASFPLSERTRVFVAEFQLKIEPDKSPLAQASIAVVPLQSEVEGKKRWRANRQQELKSLIFETAPERESERALLERQDPELDFRMRLASKSNSAPSKRDVTLIQAVDLLAAQRFLKLRKIALPPAPKGGNLLELQKDP